MAKPSKGIPPNAKQAYVMPDLTGAPWLVQYLNDVSQELFGVNGLVSTMEQRIETLEATVIDLQNQIDTYHP